jgi:ADP-heptose:LPS heptosyltransferase
MTVPMPSSEPPQFTPSPKEVAEVREMLGREACGHRPLILLNPNGSDLLPLRRWPLERYVDLARRFLAGYPEVVVAFTGAAEETSVTAELVRQVASARCVCLAGKTTLRQLLVLYTLAEVLVTNDSGPAHFATLTTVRVVTLFGPETPELFGARTPRNTVLWARLACSPCVNAFNNRQSRCRDNLCMQALTVDEVFEAGCCSLEAKRDSGRFEEAVNF